MPYSTLSLEFAAAAGTALAGGVIARLLRQSVVVGYLAAGLVLSPFTPGPTSDPETIERLADIGVVLLMFGVGVQFSLRELAGVRDAGFGAAVQIPLSIAIAGAAVRLAGWPWQESLVFGAVAAISSSIVLTKLLAERGEEASQHGRIAIVWSLAQDLSTVGLVVLLGVLAADSDELVPSVGLAIAKAAGFIGAMAIVGPRILPWVLAQVARLGSRELFILAVGGLSIGTAVISERAGLSLALGAFIAGVVVSESDLSYHALGEVMPIRDIFAALFFVSVGMLVDPRLLWDHLGLFLLIVMLVLSKGLIATAASLVLRYPPRTAVLVGLGLAPSAEFSFILARQGVESGIVSGQNFSLMLSATAATIVLAPALNRLAPVAEWGFSMMPFPAPRQRPDPVPPRLLRNHVIICGAGRVGSLIAAVLRQRGQGYLIIEMDRRRVEGLRAAGEPVLYGNCANPPVLERAQLEHARTLVVAIPDPVMTRQTVEQARRWHPRLDIVARVYTAEEAVALRMHGVAEAVIAEHELALEMARHTLHRVGVSSLEVQAIIQRLRLEPSQFGER
jgi:CPA2 family monovalent cation:H+ antiporter-2